MPSIDEVTIVHSNPAFPGAGNPVAISDVQQVDVLRYLADWRDDGFSYLRGNWPMQGSDT